MGRVLRSRALTEVGTLAYGIYMVHQGLNKVWHWAVFGTAPSIRGASTLGVTLLSLASTYALAKLSWHLLERPLIDLGHSRFTYRPKAGAPTA